MRIATASVRTGFAMTGGFARGAVVGGRRDTWVPPYTHFCRAGPVCPAVGAGKLDSGRCRHRPLRKRILWCVGEGLSCPPSCQPTDGHCRTRQSGHFLETGLLHPPLAALRRFPLPQATARVAPTEGYKRCGGVKNPPVTALPCQPPLGKGAMGTGEADCHTSLRTGLAMTGFCKECGTESTGGQRRPPLRMTRKFVQARFGPMWGAN